MAYLQKIPTQVCVELKILLSKAIMKYRTRVFFLDTILLRSHKSYRIVVAKISFPKAQAGVKITVSYQLKIDQFSKIATHFLVC